MNAVIYRWPPFMFFLLHLLCWLYFTSDVVLSIITPFMLALLLTVLTSHGCCDQALLLHPLPLYVCPSKLLWLTSFGCCSPSQASCSVWTPSTNCVNISCHLPTLCANIIYVSFSLPKMQRTLHEILIMFDFYDSKG